MSILHFRKLYYLRNIGFFSVRLSFQLQVSFELLSYIVWIFEKCVIIIKIGQVKSSSAALDAVGLDGFGLDDVDVRCLIETLPGVKKCVKYKMMDDEKMVCIEVAIHANVC